MRIHEVHFEHWVALPIERVFPFFAAPRNLPRLTPDSLHLRLEHAHLVPPPDAPAGDFAGPGSRVTVSFRPSFSPLRLQHVASITEFRWLEYFQDEFRNWQMDWTHRHEFQRAPREGVDGTSVRDRLRIGLLFGSVTFPLLARPMLAHMFAFRQQRLEELTASGAL